MKQHITSETVVVDRTVLGRALAFYLSARTGTDIYPHQIHAMYNVGPQMETTDIYQLNIVVANPSTGIGDVTGAQPQLSSAE